MCGIIGLHLTPAESGQLEQLLSAMNRQQLHRGPDGEGMMVDHEQSLGLAMRRLAILDAAGGAQPMHSEDGDSVLVFNGEIVNAPELRLQLEAAGQIFRSDHSDTEVVLHLLRREGTAGLSKLNGMFAFAFYDRRGGELLLGRDRMGIKQLYFSVASGRLAFASELKSLLTLPFIRREVDRQSLFHYLSLMYVPGEQSILSDVRRLQPGHVLRYRLADRRLQTERWWQLHFNPDPRVPTADWPEHIRDTLTAAAKRWTLSDVPVGCSLSGGLDSSALVGLLAHDGQKVATYSLGFSGQGEEAWNELPLAADVARHWGTRHHEIVMAPEDLLNDLGAMVWHLDEPYGGGLPSWGVFKAMSRDLKVGLVGSGGDELFGNYGKWLGLESPILPWQPTIGQDRFVREFFERYYYFPDADKRAALADSGVGLADTGAMLFGHFSAAGGASRDRSAITDITTQLADEFLVMTDRFSMAHSLEARPPFLDNELVDLVRTIPAGDRTHRRDLKGLLRKAVAPVLPPSLLSAGKKGFVIPLPLWLRRELRPLVERLLAPERLRRQGLFRPDMFGSLIQPYLDGRSQLTTRIWGLLMFQLWHAIFLEADGRMPPSDLAGLQELAG
jgi:asparagine synthase (glutamine-hydrolysing)